MATATESKPKDQQAGKASKEAAAKKKKKPGKYDEVIRAARHVADLWMEFRKYFRLAYAKRPIKPQEEQRFLDIKSEMAREQRILAQRLPEGIQYGAKRITELMNQAISIGALRELPVSDKKVIYEKWHEIYIALQHLLGILDLIEEGEDVHFESRKGRSGNIKESMGLTGEKKTRRKKVAVALILVLLAGGVYYWYSESSSPPATPATEETAPAGGASSAE